MKTKDKITLVVVLAGWIVMCMACSGSDVASTTAQPTPIPYPTQAVHAPWTDPKIARKIRNELGLGDGWTTAEIQREDAEYKRQMDAYNKQQGGAK